MYTIKQICKKYNVSNMTIHRRRKKLRIQGTTKNSRTLYFTKKEVEALTKKPDGIPAEQAIDLLVKNGWKHTRRTLGNILQSGEINGVRFDIDKSINRRWRYKKSQVSKIYPPPKDDTPTVSEMCEVLGISRQTYYNWKDAGILENKLKEAGLK